MLFRILIAICSVTAARAVIIDRTAIVVDRKPILDSDIDRDIRITAFLNNERPNLTLASRKAAASRLIDQEIIRQQIRTGGYAVATREETDQLLAQIRHDRFPTPTQFTSALAQYRITEAELRDRLSWQQTVLRFIDSRFRPQATVSDDDVTRYYQSNSARFDAKPIAAVRSEIVETITAERINKLFENWLDQTRKSVRIDYLEKSLA